MGFVLDQHVDFKKSDLCILLCFSEKDASWSFLEGVNGAIPWRLWKKQAGLGKMGAWDGEDGRHFLRVRCLPLEGSFDRKTLQSSLRALVALMQQEKETSIHLVLGECFEKKPDTLQDLILALEAMHDHPPSAPQKDKKVFFKKITLVASSWSPLSRAFIKKASVLAQSLRFTKHLGDTPPNVCTPLYLLKTARELRRRLPVHVSFLDHQKMAKLNMGAFLSVEKGSAQRGGMIICEYRGASKKQPPIALIGKGITFDTGGISLKPGAGMDEMKYDMGGAAAVLGVLHAVATLKLPVNLVVAVAAAENMPSGHASKPGDVVRTYSGQTVEILNTDAEGRLVLCDTMSYIQDRFKPSAMVDVATLTGAIVVALGSQAAGLFSNDERLATSLLQAGERAHDRFWRLPLWEEYGESLQSRFADMANIGDSGAGSVIAACFLSRFVKDTPWAHLDIAGVAWNKGKNKGATGRPVRALLEWIETHAPSPSPSKTKKGSRGKK